VEKSTKNTLNNISELTRREIAKSPAQWWRKTLLQKDIQKFVKKTRRRFGVEVGHPEELNARNLKGLRDWIDRYVSYYVKRVYDVDLHDHEDLEAINVEVQRVHAEIIDGFEHYIVTGKYPHTLPDGINGGARVVEFPVATGETLEMVSILASSTTDFEAAVIEGRRLVQERFGKAQDGSKVRSPIRLWLEGLPIEERRQPNNELARQYLIENPSATYYGLPTRIEVRRTADNIRKFKKRNNPSRLY